MISKKLMKNIGKAFLLDKRTKEAILLGEYSVEEEIVEFEKIDGMENNEFVRLSNGLIKAKKWGKIFTISKLNPNPWVQNAS
jgi:hypothetical protein